MTITETQPERAPLGQRLLGKEMPVLTTGSLDIWNAINTARRHAGRAAQGGSQ
jgi:hypothetical protein